MDGCRQRVQPGSRAGPEAEEPAATTLRQALASPAFWAITWSFSFTGIGMYSVSLQVPAYLVSVGYQASTAAEVVGVIGLLLPFGVVGFGWLADAIGRRPAMALAYGLSIIGIVSLMHLAAGPSTASGPAASGWCAARRCTRCRRSPSRPAP